MTGKELREKCGLDPSEYIKTNKGDVDILYIDNDIVTLCVLLTGKIHKESVKNVISKFGKRTEEDKQITEAELRKKCGLKSGECINSNLGALDILGVSNGTVSIGVIASGKVFYESVSSVIKKLEDYKKKNGNNI